MDNINTIKIKSKIKKYYLTKTEYFEKLDDVFCERGDSAYRRGSFDILRYLESSSCILDVGCGSGSLLAYLKRLYPNKEYYGIDISPLAIDKANNKNSNLDSPITFTVADAEEEIPFKDEFFDLVIAYEVFEHFVHPYKVLENISKAMKKNGILFLLSPNRLVRSPLNIKMRKVYDYLKMVISKEYINPTIVEPPLDIVGGDSDAVYVTDPWELRRMVKMVGLVIVKQSFLKCRIVARKQ